MAKQVITKFFWSRFPVPCTRPEIWFVHILKGFSPRQLLIPCAGEGNSEANCSLFFLTGVLVPVCLCSMGESSTSFGAASRFQLTRPQLRFVQILKGLCPIPLLMLCSAKGIAELIAV